MTRHRSARCPQVELAVGWAMHALEPGEEAAVAAHLPQCAECSEIVRETEEALALLALADAEQPPPALRKRLMGQLASGRRPVVVPSAREPTSSSPAPEGEHQGAATGRSWRHRAALLVAAAAVLLTAVGGLTAQTLQLAHQRDAAANRSDQLARVLAATEQPGTQHALLSAPAGQPAAVLLDDGKQRILVPVGLAPNDPRATTYVLWGTETGPPVALAAFDVSSDEVGRLPVRSDSTAGSFQGYAISLEPGRTLPASPSRVVASGQLAT